MRVAIGSEERKFRAQCREYFADFIRDQTYDALIGEDPVGYRAMVRLLARDNYLGMALPTDYGGLAWPALKQMIFSDEAERAGVFLPHLTISTVAPLLAQHASEGQKRRFLPGVIAGETLFSIGYTESNSGSDLASLRTRAVRDGNEYVINGQKLYTSRITTADYVWLAARTDPEAAKHAGISVFLVPVTAPGFSTTPLPVLGHVATSVTHYNDVRVSADDLIGRENGGWALITGQLNRERVILFTGAPLEHMLEEVTAWAARTDAADGRRVIEHEWVQMNLAEVRARNDFTVLLSSKLCAQFDADRLGPGDASINKVFATENLLDGYRRLMEVMGLAATVRGNEANDLGARLAHQYNGALIKIFGGGANDILRDFVSKDGVRLAGKAH